MAKQTSILLFSGKLGNLIGYQRNGKYYQRSRPASVHQTGATRRAAKRFGIASRTGALIRHACSPDIHCDSGHINRLNKVLITAGGDFTAMTGFRFNQHTGTDSFFTIAPRLFRNEVLHVPSQHIIPHKGVTALEVKVIATRFDFVSVTVTGRDVATLLIDPKKPFEGTDIALDIPGEGTLVVVFQVRALLSNSLSHDKRYMAADIITVATPQKPASRNKQTYPWRAIRKEQHQPDFTYQPAHPGPVQLE